MLENGDDLGIHAAMIGLCHLGKTLSHGGGQPDDQLYSWFAGRIRMSHFLPLSNTRAPIALTDGRSLSNATSRVLTQFHRLGAGILAKSTDSRPKV